MPHNRFEWIDRLKFVEREHRVVATAIARLRLAILEGLVRTPDGTTPRDLVAASENLETTYLVRLWAEFETALLSYYRDLTGDPEAHIKATDLVNTLAGVRRGRAIADEVRAAVHEVREYRNSLVHERTDPAPPVGLVEARSRLVTHQCFPGRRSPFPAARADSRKTPDGK
jgi:hypothetical protein